MPKVSVTVPVYNTSEYLRRCLDSLLAQTLDDIEFILVDDGSTDNSGTICDEYLKKDSRFTVIHQVNGGLASARETGLQNANGEYIIVCDSDDWVEPTMYEEMYALAKEKDADIVICDYFINYDNGKQVRESRHYSDSDGIIDNREIVANSAGSSWVKLIRKSLFTEGKIHYEPGINLSEDSLIVYKLMQLNPRVIKLDKPLYHYSRVFGGASYTNSLSMAHIKQLEYTYKWLREHYDKTTWNKVIQNRAIDLVFACFRCKDIKPDFVRSFLKSELSWYAIFNHLNTPKGIFIGVSKIIPINLSKYLVNKLYKFVYK